MISSAFAECTLLKFAKRQCTPEELAQIQKITEAASQRMGGTGTARTFGMGAWNASSLMAVRQTNGMEIQCSIEALAECEDDIPMARPLPNEYSDFLISFSEFDLGMGTEKKTKNCECIKQNLERKSGRKFEQDLKKEQEELNKKILAAYGRKFVNEFAANLEDASFFLRTNKGAFTDEEKAKGIQCIDPDVFQKKVQEVCAEKGIKDQSFIKKRQDFFINSVDGGKKSFGQRLVEMSDEMQSLPMPSPDGKDTKLYTRAEYDRARIGLAHSNENAIVAEHIVRKMLLHPETMGYMARFHDKGTPGYGLVYYLEESIRENKVDKFGFDLNVVGSTILDVEKIKTAFKYLMNTHPGFMTALAEDKVFERLQQVSSLNPEKNLLTLLETEPKILEPELFERCKLLQKDFANAVCTSDDDLVTSADPDDLDDLIHAGEPEGKHHSGSDSFHEYLLCQEKNKDKPRVISDLAPLFDPNLPARKSDFLERLLVKDLKKHQNPFTQSMIRSSEEDYRGEMADATVRGDSIAKAVSPGGVASATAYARAVSEGKAFSFGKPMMTREEARDYLAESRKYDEKIQAAKYANEKIPAEVKPGATAPDYSTVSETSYVTPTPVPPSPVKPRDELSNYLTKKYPAEEVKRTVEELPDQDVSDLNKIKNETTSMLTQTLKEETSRMEQLQSRIEELKKQMSEKAPTKAVTETKKEPVAKPTLSNLSEVFTAAQPMKEVSQVKPQATSTSPVQSAGTAKVSGTSRNFAASTSFTGPAITLVVTAQAPVSGEINQEIRKQLESLTLDPKAIEELKSKGFVFRYTVMENNKLVQKEMLIEYSSLDEATKQMIELRSLEKQKQNQVSKLAVLRMILKNR